MEEIEAKEQLKQILFDKTGIRLGGSNEYLLNSRLDPIMKRYEIASMSDFIVNLERDLNLMNDFVDSMTTHETSFFRDIGFFVWFESYLKSRGDKEINIWSAACSTGQEVYSLAISINEIYGTIPSRVKIKGSDISLLSVMTAIDAQYNDFELSRGLGKNHLEKYFDKTTGGYRLKDFPWKSQIDLKPMNLCYRPSWGVKFDLVLLRNVLIYFDAQKKKEVLENIQSVLKPDGKVAIGASEILSTPDWVQDPKNLFLIQPKEWESKAG